MIRYIFLTVLMFVFCAFSFVPIHAQTGVSLEAEIQNIKREILRSGISAEQRHDALVRLARLRQLSGDIEGAARNWLEAAAAIPGRVDDEALLNCAFCLAAMGEWDRAAAALEPLLTRMPRARFLDLSIRAIRTGNPSALGAIADNPEYQEIRAEILFVLWRVTRDNSWRQRLVSEFPQSPEGRLAAGESASIIVRPNPFWLFANGLDSLPLIESASVGQPAQTSTSSSSTAGSTAVNSVTPAAQVAATNPVASQSQPASPSTASPTTGPAPSVPRLQTGIFSRQANAQTQAANLRNAGFSPTIERRVVNNNEMWAVTVPAGADSNGTMRRLRDAGFDAFLLR